MIVDEKIKNSVVSQLCGPDVIPVVDFLKGKENVSEFIIVDELNLSINELRNILYRLQKVALISFKRKKDKKKGWYVYYWTLQPQLIYFLYEKMLKEKLVRLESRLEREKKSTFYLCKNKCIRLNFDQAILFSFTCPECGETLFESDNSKIINKINSEIDGVKKDFEEFYSVLYKVREAEAIEKEKARKEAAPEDTKKKRGRKKKSVTEVNKAEAKVSKQKKSKKQAVSSKSSTKTTLKKNKKTKAKKIVK